MRWVVGLGTGMLAALMLATPAAGTILREPAAVARTSIVVSIPLRTDGLFAVKDVGVRVTAKSAKRLPKVLWLRLANEDELPGVTVLADVGRGTPKGKTVRFFVRIAVGTDAASPVQRPAGPQVAEIEIGSIAPYRVVRVAGVWRGIAYSFVLSRLEGAPSPVPWASSGYLGLGLGLPATPFDPEAAARLLEEAGWTDENGDGARDADDVPLYKVETLTAAQAGGENPRVNAVSLDGTAVGASGSPSARRAFVWNTTDGSVTPIDRPAGATSCIAQGISYDATTVVGNCASGQHAWFWTAEGGLHDLGVGNAYGAAGNVIVGSSGGVAGVWVGGVFTPLPGAVNPSAAYAISEDSAYIAGFNGVAATVWKANPSGGYALDRTSAAPGTARAWFDVNLIGEAAGIELLPRGDWRAAWEEFGYILKEFEYIVLGNPPGKAQGEANAINASGVVGGRFAESLPADAGEQGFFHYNTDLFVDAGVQYPTQFGSLGRVSDITDLGHVAGETTINGRPGGWVVTPETRASLSALLQLVGALEGPVSRISQLHVNLLMARAELETGTREHFRIYLRFALDELENPPSYLGPTEVDMLKFGLAELLFPE